MNYLPKVSNFRTSNPLLAKIFLGTSALSFALSTYNYFSANSAQEEIQFRKRQLAKPIYILSDDQHVNPPWNKDNIRNWLYRRVSGRPIHRLQCMIPRTVSGGKGFQCVLPLVTAEEQDRKNQQGLILSTGYIPFNYRNIQDRFRFEDVRDQVFVGFVSQLSELQEHDPLKGNSTTPQKLKFTYANMKDFVKVSGFQNKEQASVALIERLHQTGDLNERSPQRHQNTAGNKQDYPFAKTEAGALQLQKMPWDYKNSSKNYLAFSLASFIMGSSLF